MTWKIVRTGIYKLSWIIVGPGKISIGKNYDADATVSAKDEILADIIDKKLHPATAILQRKVVLKGKIHAIAKFRPEFFGIKPKL